MMPPVGARLTQRQQNGSRKICTIPNIVNRRPAARVSMCRPADRNHMRWSPSSAVPLLGLLAIANGAPASSCGPAYSKAKQVGWGGKSPAKITRPPLPARKI